jgi:hypothetical protein
MQNREKRINSGREEMAMNMLRDDLLFQMENKNKFQVK